MAIFRRKLVSRNPLLRLFGMSRTRGLGRYRRGMHSRGMLGRLGIHGLIASRFGRMGLGGLALFAVNRLFMRRRFA